MSFQRSPSRRNFLTSTAGAASLLGLGDTAFLSRLRPVFAEEARVDPSTVQFDSGIEPTVRLIEDTPRERLLEEVAARIEKGLSYRELLAALQLAGVRNVQPRPSVGHKFHAVLVVNSAHLASLASPPQHRWLPIFWALDYFKSAAARDVREGNWTMQSVDESAVPGSTAAGAAFTAAMDGWDESAADVAAAGLARAAGENEVYERFFRYGARDFRSIGHKAIFVANSRRTLHCIGWRHAEPVVRSLAYALLMHEGDNPAGRDADADRPFRTNQQRLTQIRPDWRDGKLDDGATQELLAALRSDANEAVCDLTVEILNRGVSPQSVWDGLLVGAGELLMRQPGIVALHALTTTNALRYAYDASGDDETRRLVLLQNAAFLPMFRDAMHGRGAVRDLNVEALQPAALDGPPEEAIGRIFAQIDGDPLAAAASTLGYLQAGNSAESLIDAARVLVYLKGNDAHDYKFSSAVLEDYYKVSPAWRDRFLAANVFKLQGSARPDNALVQRTREAFKA
ncbi:hypothetical protein [Alienimonas sp. DA493]|uniref:hypothetical protein n=1 Tax=Alienimonas sp. DA493 TaxID=3373605 RepID=UPI0037544E45